MTKIFVTQENIDNGEICQARRCPIALALIDAGFTDPAVYGIEATASDATDRIYFRVPREGAIFASRFDYGAPVTPQEFTLTELERKPLP